MIFKKEYLGSYKFLVLLSIQILYYTHTHTHTWEGGRERATLVRYKQP